MIPTLIGRSTSNKLLILFPFLLVGMLRSSIYANPNAFGLVSWCLQLKVLGLHWEQLPNKDCKVSNLQR